MNQLICASLSHTNYWYDMGKLKLPAVVHSSSLKYYEVVVVIILEVVLTNNTTTVYY